MSEKLIEAMRSTINMSSTPLGEHGARVVIEMSDETALYELLSNAWDAAKRAPQNTEIANGYDYCPWCSDPMLPGQTTAMSDGERMHIGCAAEDMDNATFDRDFGG